MSSVLVRVGVLTDGTGLTAFRISSGAAPASLRDRGSCWGFLVVNGDLAFGDLVFEEELREGARIVHDPRGQVVDASSH